MIEYRRPGKRRIFFGRKAALSLVGVSRRTQPLTFGRLLVLLPTSGTDCMLPRG
jgi:hypothetical protein